MVRDEQQKRIISNGSVFKLSLPGKKEHINIKTGSDLELKTEDYKSCFKVVQANEREELRNAILAHLTMFIRSYDDQALIKTYDFTSQAAFSMLSKVLKSMKRLCLNTLPSVYDSVVPYKIPNEEIQTVLQDINNVNSCSERQNALTLLLISY